MIDKKDQQLASGGLGRRSFINTAALVGLTAGVAACTEKPGTAAAPAAPAAPASSHAGAGANVHLKPGELDTYYGLWSGGHNGRRARAGPAIGPRDPPASPASYPTRWWAGASPMNPRP